MPNSRSRANILRTSGGERMRVNFTFRPNAALEPTDFYSPDNIFSVAREGPAGQYIVSLAAGVFGSRRLVGHGCELQMNGAHGNRAYLGDGPSLTATGVAQWRLYTVDIAGAGVNLAAAAGTRVSMWLELEETGT